MLWPRSARAMSQMRPDGGALPLCLSGARVDGLRRQACGTGARTSPPLMASCPRRRSWVSSWSRRGGLRARMRVGSVRRPVPATMRLFSNPGRSDTDVGAELGPEHLRCLWNAPTPGRRMPLYPRTPNSGAGHGLGHVPTRPLATAGAVVGPGRKERSQWLFRSGAAPEPRDASRPELRRHRGGSRWSARPG